MKLQEKLLDYDKLVVDYSFAELTHLLVHIQHLISGDEFYDNSMLKFNEKTVIMAINYHNSLILLPILIKGVYYSEFSLN